MTTTDLSPIGLTATPPGTKPCAVCGIPTTGPTTKYPVMTRVVVIGQGERVDEMGKNAGIELPTCAACLDIASLAAQIVQANPGIVRALGDVATWQVTAALYGLSAIGERLPALDLPPARLGSLVHRLAVPGGAVMFVRKFAPIWQADSSTKHAARERWSAANPDVIADCRRGALDWKADGRPVRSIPHPQRLRCSWCGTGTAEGRRVSEAWFGDLCATCAGVQAVGGTFYESFLDHLDPDHAIRRRRPYAPDLDGVTPWRKSGGGDGAAWSHIDVAGARELLAIGDW